MFSKQTHMTVHHIYPLMDPELNVKSVSSLSVTPFCLCCSNDTRWSAVGFFPATPSPLTLCSVWMKTLCFPPQRSVFLQTTLNITGRFHKDWASSTSSSTQFRWTLPLRCGRVSLTASLVTRPAATSGTATRSGGATPPNGPTTTPWCWRELPSITSTDTPLCFNETTITR